MPLKSLSLTVLLLLLGCADAGSVANDPAIADSAGVSIVTNGMQGIEWDSVSGDLQTVLSIGAAPDTLHDVRAVAADARGRVYVADGAQVRVFDDAGRFVRNDSQAALAALLATPQSRAVDALLESHGPMSPSGIFMWPAPSARTADAAFIAESTSPYTVNVYDLDGRLQRRISRASVPRAVQDEWLEEARIRIAEWYDDQLPQPANRAMQQRAMIAKLEEMWLATKGTYVSPLRRLLADSEGSMWVERTDLSPDPAGLMLAHIGLAPHNGRHPASMWDVFTPAGRLLGTVRLPRGFDPRHVDGRTVLGVHTDELNTKYVVRFRIEEPRPKKK